LRLAVWVGLFLCPGVGPIIVFGPLVGWIVGALGLVLVVVGYDDDNDKAARVRLLK